MKKSFAFALVVVLVGFVFVSPVHAKQAFNWGKQINASQCDKVGDPVIDVTETIVNSVDSGEGGNYWAYDNLTRQIQVWAQNDSTYCAVVRNEGSFDSQAGQKSPGNTGDLSGSEDGTFQGGYRATVTGTLKADPAWPTQGYVGVTNYYCDLNGDCPGYVSWLGQYFDPGYGFSYLWWGWIYNVGPNVWINAITGNSGDIL